MSPLAVLCLIPMLLLSENGVRFADEFNGSDVDLAKWVPHDPRASGKTPDVAAVSGGLLHLGKGQTMTTFGTFSQAYGRVEIRARLMAGARFRLLPARLADIPSIEVFSFPGPKLSLGNSWGDEKAERWFGDEFEGPGPGFHVIAAVWEKAKIRWSVDGKDRLEATEGVPDAAMFLEMEGPMDVDYVRVSAGN